MSKYDKIITEYIEQARHDQLLRLYEKYYVERTNNRFTSVSEVFIRADMIQGFKNERDDNLTMITYHEDNEEVLPLFCVRLHGGGFVTCYPRPPEHEEELEYEGSTEE